MIEPQIIKENGKPKAVIIDYKQYLKFQELQKDSEDYLEAIEAERTTKKWKKLDDAAERLGIK